MEEAPIKVKIIRNWSAKTFAKRLAVKEQKSRDRDVIKNENSDPANIAWVKKVRNEMRGGTSSKRRKSVAKKAKVHLDGYGSTKREVKILEKLKATAATRVKRKRRASAKCVKGLLSADQHKDKNKKGRIHEARGFYDELRTSGAAPIAPGGKVAEGRG